MIEKFFCVDKALRAEADALLAACEEADRFKMELYTDASINEYKDMECAFAARENGVLRGFLFVFAPSRDEVEINALVHPAFRRQGLFKALLHEATAVCSKFGYSRGYLFCNGASAGAMQMMAHWQLRLGRIEYQMQYDITRRASPTHEDLRLVKAAIGDVKEAAVLLSEIFGYSIEQEEEYLAKNINSPARTQWMLKRHDQIVGFCGTYQDGQANVVVGLGVLPAERRKGYARIILDLVADATFAQALQWLSLDVDSDNPNAISLYKSYGFVNRSATHYYEFRF